MIMIESEGITEGSRTVTWDGRDARSRLAPAGTYLVKITAGGSVVVGEGRVVLVR